MKRVNFDHLEVLIGLDWDVASESRGSQGAQIRGMLKNERHRGCRFGAVINNIDEGGRSILNVGFLPASEKIRPKIPSAAATLALASQKQRLSGSTDSGLSTTESGNWNWIVIEKIDDDAYWMVAIFNGAPLASTDVVGRFDEIIESTELLLQRPESDFVVHTRDDKARDLLVHSAEVSELGFSDLVGDGSQLKIADAIPRQLAGMRWPLFIVAIGMLVLILGTIFFMHWKHEHERELRLAKLRQESAANARKMAAAESQYERDVQKAVDNALKSGKTIIDAQLKTPSPALVVNRWQVLLNQVELDQTGWNLTSASCTAGNKPKCTVHLKRGNDGINRSLLEMHPDAKIDGDKASFVLKDSLPNLADRSPDWGQLQDAHSMMVNLMSDLQLLRHAGLEYRQTGSREIVQMVDMPKSTFAKFKPGSTKNLKQKPEVQMGVAKGTLGMSGKSMWQLVGLGEYLDQSGITLSNMDLKFKGAGLKSWKLTANYYLRSKPQPQLPMIMSSGKPIPLQLPSGFNTLYQATGGVSASMGSAIEMPSTSPTSGAQETPGDKGKGKANLNLPPPPPPPPKDKPPVQPNDF